MENNQINELKLLKKKVKKLSLKLGIIAASVTLGSNISACSTQKEPYKIESSTLDISTEEDQKITPKKEISALDIDLEDAQKKIDTEIEKIIKELNLEKSDNTITQLKNCCLVQKYIAEHITYDKSIMKEKKLYPKKEKTIRDLYNAVILHKGVCTSYSLMFKEITKKLGINTEIIALISNGSGIEHASNIVELDGEYYFFDSTSESSIYHKNNKDGNIVLCCAGLGKYEYYPYYKPVCVLPDNPLDNLKPLPNNISEYRIPEDLVNFYIADNSNKPKQY